MIDVALPDEVIGPVRLALVVTFDAVPVKLAVIVPAEKLPEASRKTRVSAVLVVAEEGIYVEDHEAVPVPEVKITVTSIRELPTIA